MPAVVKMSNYIIYPPRGRKWTLLQMPLPKGDFINQEAAAAAAAQDCGTLIVFYYIHTNQQRWTLLTPMPLPKGGFSINEKKQQHPKNEEL
jgi:hypothetical protein